MILLFPAREVLEIDIPAGEGKIGNLSLQCDDLTAASDVTGTCAKACFWVSKARQSLIKQIQDFQRIYSR
jgi:hypothetical protein